MDKFDVRGAKLITIFGIIIFIFIMVIANAYQYLPEKSDNIASINTEINVPADEDETQVQTEETAAEETEQPVRKEENKKGRLIGSDDSEPVEKVSEPELIPLENISENDNTKETVQADIETYESVTSNAKQRTSEKKFVNAISEYQKAITLAKTPNEKANCYEEISTIYAMAKKYGTALSYAQKAYNLSPSTSREILLARLYYKTGAADKASERINNVMRRDFSQDR